MNRLRLFLISFLIFIPSLVLGDPGDTLIVFLPNSQDAPTLENFATLDARSGASPTMLLDFDATTNEYAVFKAIMPVHYADGGVNVAIHFSTGTVTSGTVAWGVAWEELTSGATGFTTINSSGTSVAGTRDQLATTTIAFSNGADMDSVSDSEVFRIYVIRLADGTQTDDGFDDDVASDASIEAIEIREQ